jgi:NADH-quinone oxidoreductase subunit C
MTPEELGARFCAHVDGAIADVSFGGLTVDVPTQAWVEAAIFARDDELVACSYFDFLSAYDDVDAGTAVVLHLWSTKHRHHVIVRTHVTSDGGRLPTLTSAWPGANWHERETYEMFGIVFDGHPNLVSLLLPDGFEGHPLRKDFVLASRVAKSWPGAKEPGESDRDLAGAPPARRRMQPPGVPDPGSWGPEAGPTASAEEPGAAP